MKAQLQYPISRRSLSGCPCDRARLTPYDVLLEIVKGLIFLIGKNLEPKRLVLTGIPICRCGDRCQALHELVVHITSPKDGRSVWFLACRAREIATTLRHSTSGLPGRIICLKWVTVASRKGHFEIFGCTPGSRSSSITLLTCARCADMVFEKMMKSSRKTSAATRFNRERIMSTER